MVNARKDEEKLLARVAQHYQTMLGDSITRIGEAIDNDEARQASFTVTVTFTKDSKGNLEAKIMPRERIPLPGVKLKLTVDDDGQMALFGGHGSPEPVPAPRGMGDNEDENAPPPAH